MALRRQTLRDETNADAEHSSEVSAGQVVSQHSEGEAVVKHSKSAAQTVLVNEDTMQTRH